jgi:hypothetical protein
VALIKIRQTSGIRIKPRRNVGRELNLNPTADIVAGVRLRAVSPRRSVNVARRGLYVADRPFDLLAGGAEAVEADFPDPHAHHLVDAFITGQIVSVCLCGEHNADLKRLQDVDEVWVLCFRKVRMNQWRVLGRFSRQDCFVGLTIHRRDEIGTRKKYTKAASDFISFWNIALRGAQPLRGSHWVDYLTGPVQDLDASLT